MATKTKSARFRRLEKKRREGLIFADTMHREYQRGYELGLRAGKEAAQKDLDAEMAMKSLEARIKLGGAYAQVFEAIARSANMYFDCGANTFR